MLRVCANCGDKLPYQISINNKIIDLRSRKYCLKCNPVGSRLFYSNKLAHRSPRLPKIKRICSSCNKPFYQKTRGLVCSTCKSRYIRHQLKAELIKNHGGKCKICGFDKFTEALTFHHLDQATKNFNLAQLYQKSKEEVFREADKCILLCENCHRGIHAHKLELPK